MKARLLVIDDDIKVRDSIAAHLENSGYCVITVGSGTEGLQILDQKSVDLVLCDLRMPSLDGLEVLRQVKDRNKHIPFIIVSGACVMEDVVQALRLGASDYIVKPIVDMVFLEHSIQRNLDLVSLEVQNERYRNHLETVNRTLQKNLDELRSDQQAGRQVQLKMLPEPLRHEQLQMTYTIKPSLMLSGDFVDYIALDKKHYGFYIADVSGHGASSAFVTMLLKNLTHRLKRNLNLGLGDELYHPVKVLERINEELLDIKCGKHLTIVYCVLNLETLQLTYSIGAHLPMPILYCAGKAQYLEGKGMPVGLFQGAKYNEYRVQLPEKFSLSMFSDGVFEILSQPTLALKERYLLDLVESEAGNHESISQTLRLNSDDEILDDVALLTVVGI